MRYFSFLLSVILIGCGSDTTTEETEPKGPPNEGAVSASFRTSSLSTAGKQCNLAVHEMQLGFAHASSAGQITFVEDGVSDATVSCSVEGDSSFAFSGRIEIGSSIISFEASDVQATDSETDRRAVSISYQTMQTISTLESPAGEPCGMWFNPDQEIAAGRVWFMFECNLVEDSDRSCGLQQSVAAFQNCAQD